ncbi:menin [Exaiptasia diaphana]|uniref:Menin n=1 Tax=Exaiptasia diaphana TaxID=2652724 RepID=A0A913XBH8_EXADI|nr:menin [Exaiptasia diaphana]
MDARKNFFPLKDNESVMNFFKEELKKDQPNLAQLSLILGFFEEANTCKAGISDPATSSCPNLDEETYDALYCKFMALLQRDFSFNAENKPATREFVKSVADLVWGCLAKSYFKDRPHIQNLYSFLTGNRLDCFGVALTVVAMCQALGYNDVHLCLSEDHAWVCFGFNGSETAEVTWHGKGNEDKRGRPVEFEGETAKSWLYLSGFAVRCTRHMEVASIVSSINVGISHNKDSVELANLQKELLWILYDTGHLKRYPMALGNLADQEEISPTPGRPPCKQIFEEAIAVAKEVYNNQHIYPYTYLGGYYNRKKQYIDAIKYWVEAAHVAGKYNYSKEDEEMYKEFYEIANDFIPNILKVGATESDAVPFTKDPEFFSYMLQFYDGICLWEEDSLTPVLHADWAKKLVQSLNKFTSECRSTFSPDKEGEKSNDAVPSDEKEKPNKPEVSLVLNSAKMKDLRKLITTGGKLNTSAIKLQLTAQSQVSVPKSRRRSSLKADVYLYDYDDQIKEEGGGAEDDDLFYVRKRRKKDDDRNWSAALS